MYVDEVRLIKCVMIVELLYIVRNSGIYRDSKYAIYNFWMGTTREEGIKVGRDICTYNSIPKIKLRERITEPESSNGKLTTKW